MMSIEEMFAMMCEEVGCGSWWEAEEYWEELEARMIEAGLDAEEVSAFFSELAWDM